MSVPWYLMAKGKGTGGYKTASGPIVSISDAVAAPLRSLLVNIDPVQEGSGDPSPENKRPISGWTEANVWVKLTYDPTVNPTATIQLGQTVYGGTLDVTAGTLTVKYASEILNCVYYFNKYSNYYLWFLRSPDTNPRYKLQGDSLSDIFAPRQYLPGHLWTGSETAYIGVVGPDQSLTTQEKANAWMADHPAQVVFELATPIEYTLSPQEISTLQGQNNVWADTGDSTVEYLASGGADPDLMKLAVAFMGRR